MSITAIWTYYNHLEYYSEEGSYNGMLKGKSIQFWHILHLTCFIEVRKWKPRVVCPNEGGEVGKQIKGLKYVTNTNLQNCILSLH